MAVRTVSCMEMDIVPWSMEAPVSSAPASFSRSAPDNCSSANISKNGIFFAMELPLSSLVTAWEQGCGNSSAAALFCYYSWSISAIRASTSCSWGTL